MLLVYNTTKRIQLHLQWPAPILSDSILAVLGHLVPVHYD